MSKRESVANNRAAILAAASRHGAERIRLFGSVARGEERPDSDIDFIVKMMPGRGAFDLVDLRDDLAVTVEPVPEPMGMLTMAAAGGLFILLIRRP